MATCPKCNASISKLIAVSVPVIAGKTEVNGSLFTCPGCGLILGAGVDPQAVVKATAEAVVFNLRQG